VVNLRFVLIFESNRYYYLAAGVRNIMVMRAPRLLTRAIAIMIIILLVLLFGFMYYAPSVGSEKLVVSVLYPVSS
jgi:hypothetical protein